MTQLRPLRLLHESLLRSAERTPDKVALVTGETRTTYAELLEAATRFECGGRAGRPAW